MLEKEGGFDSKESIAGFAILLFALAAVVLSVLVFIAFFIASRSLYLSAYGTGEAIIDASGVDITGALTAAIPAGGSSYYLMSTALILAGILRIVIVGLVIGIFTEFLAGIRIRDKLGILAIWGLKGHIVLCGYSELGAKIVERFDQKKGNLVIIDRDAAKYDLLRAAGYRVIHGDFTRAETLRAALIGSARHAIFSSDDDFVNLIGIVTAKNLNPRLNVISRAQDANTVTKMQRAGANMCVIPEVLAGQEMGSELIRRCSNG